METRLIGLPKPPARIAITTVDLCDLWRQPVGLIRRWLTNAGHEVVDKDAKPDAFVTVYLQQDVDATLHLVASGVPYVAVLTEQPQHVTWSFVAQVLYVGGAAAVWTMDAGDAAMVAARPGPCPPLAVVPCMVGTYFDDDIPEPKTPTGPSNIVLHLGAATAYRDQACAAIAAAVTAAGAVFDKMEHLQTEPARSHRLATASVVVVVNRDPGPAMYTMHRLGFMLRARRPGSVILVERCDDASSATWTRVLTALAPVVLLVDLHAMPLLAAAAVTNPAFPRPTPADEARVHLVLRRFATWDGSTDWVHHVLTTEAHEDDTGGPAAGASAHRV
jgi:hypothetical protein